MKPHAFGWFDSIAALLAAVVGVSLLAISSARPLFGSAPAPGTSGMWSGAFGILTPAVELTRIAPQQLTFVAICAAVLLTTILTASAPRTKRAPPVTPFRSLIRTGPQGSWWPLYALVLCALAARIMIGATTPLESDELVTLRTVGDPIFESGHDTWLHPPLYRALQLSWQHIAGLVPGAVAPLAFRAIGLGFTATAILVLASAFRSVAPDAARCGLLAVPFLGQDIVYASSLARPYAVCFLLSAVFIALLLRSERTRTSLALPMCVCAGIAVWFDVVYGAALALLLAMHLGSRREWGTLARSTLALTAWWFVLLPGIAQATFSPVLSQHYTSTNDGIYVSQLGEPSSLELVTELAAFSMLGISEWFWGALIIGAAIYLGVRRRDLSANLNEPWVRVFLIMAALCFVLGTLRGLRQRNILFLPILWAMCLPVRRWDGRYRSRRTST